MEKIKRLFSRKAKEAEQPKELSLEKQKWLSPKWFRRIFRTIETSMGGPNMPKKQPCPKCRAWVPREAKSMSGAHYRCSRCKLRFLVLASAKSRRE